MIDYTTVPKMRVEIIFSKEMISQIKLSKAKEFILESRDPAVHSWFECYLQGLPLPELPLMWEEMSPFRRKVLKTLQNTREILSYGDLARLIGMPGASRAVGGALNKNPFPIVVPCHRIISSNGQIGGYAYGAQLKKELLAFEKSRLARKSHLVS